MALNTVNGVYVHVAITTSAVMERGIKAVLCHSELFINLPFVTYGNVVLYSLEMTEIRSN